MKPNFIYAICSLQSVVTVVLLALAQATQAAEPKELVIEQVVVSYDFEAGEGGATIFGRNFPDFEKLRVALAGSEVGIEVLAASDAHVDIRLPEDLIVGEYRLTLYKAKEGSVCKHSPSKNCDEYDLTISDVEQRLTGLKLFLLDCRNIPIDERGQTCKLVFATSEAYTGSLGGLSGADSKCNDQAATLGYPGTFNAMLSTNGTLQGAVARLAEQAYYNVDGLKVADSKADLADGSLANPIKSSGSNTTPYLVWTGIYPQLPGSAFDCEGWQNTQGRGDVGDARRVDQNWMAYGATGCTQTAALYCFQN